MPEKDEFLPGHKYPFNSCEILCSENGFNIDKLLKMKQLKKKDENINNDKKEETKINEENNNSNLNNIKNKDIEEENKNEIKDKDKEKNELNSDEKKNNEEKKDNIKEGEDNLKNKNSEENGNIKDNKDNQKEKNDKDNEIKEDDKEKKNMENKDIENKDIKENEQKENDINSDKKEEKEEKQENEKKDEKEEKDEEKIIDINNKNEDKDDDFVSSINDVEEEKEDEKEEEQEEIIDEEQNKKIIKDELLQSLFNFLDSESSTQNPVLSGYFNKITNFLLKRNTKFILEFILDIKENEDKDNEGKEIKKDNEDYKNNKILNKLLLRIGQASIGNIVENILNALAGNIILNSDKHFNYILEFLLDLISKKDCNDNTIEVICQIIINSIAYNNKLKFVSFIESSLIQKIKEVIKTLYDNKDEKKIIYMIDLVTKINNNILINLEKRVTPKLDFEGGKVEIINIIKVNDRNSYQYYTYNDIKTNSDYIFNTYKLNSRNYCISVDEICLMVINDIMSENNEQKDKNRFGINNIYKFEFIRSVIDLFINNLELDVDQRVFITEKLTDLIKTNIFNKINDLYFIYKNNNIYANIYSQIISIVVNDNSPKQLIENIFLVDEKDPEKNLISLLIDDIVNNLKYIFEETKNEMYSLSFGNNVSILNSIFLSNNIYIKEIIDKNPKQKFFNEMFVQNIMKQFNKKLYKINDNIEQKKVDVLNPYFDAQKEQSDTNIPFSLQTFKEIVSLYLLVYEKYNKNEEYQDILKNNEEELEVSILYILSYLIFL